MGFLKDLVDDAIDATVAVVKSPVVITARLLCGQHMFGHWRWNGKNYERICLQCSEKEVSK